MLSFPDLGGEVNTSYDAMKPLSLSPQLEAYLRQCWLRPAFIEANQLEKVKTSSNPNFERETCGRCNKSLGMSFGLFNK